MDFLAYCGLIPRQVPCQLCQLGGEQASHREYEREREYDHAHNAQPAWDPNALEKSNEGSQHETKKNCQGDRDYDLATEIQRHNNDDSEDSCCYRAQQSN